MASLKEIEENIKLTTSIKNIANAYHQIATMRMNEIREDVLETRKFLNGIAEIYNHAKTAYVASLEEKDKKPEELSFIRRNRKKTIVFLSANERFYGTLILDTWKRVMNSFNKEEADLVVIGEIGRQLARAQGLEKEIEYFKLDDEDPTPEQLKKVLNFIKEYEKIIVFHGRFESVLYQNPVRTDVSGGVTLEEAPEKTKDYLFEPSPKAILQFFETEIIEALFKQTILEHQLARFASRMVAMDEATQNAKEKIKKLNKKTRRLKRRIQNKKQLETIIRSGLLNNKES